LDVAHQWLEFGAVAPAGEDGEPFGGKFLGDLGADLVAGADHRRGGIALLHVMASVLTKVIPGWCVSTRPQMRNCASGNLGIPNRRSAPSGMTSQLSRCAYSCDVISQAPSLRRREVAPCRRRFPCRRRTSVNRTRRARQPTAYSRSALPLLRPRPRGRTVAWHP